MSYTVLFTNMTDSKQTLDSGAKTHKLFKVPVAELAEWDATHDAVGRTMNDAGSSEPELQADEKITAKV